MADIRTANIAKMVTKQAGRAKEKVRNLTFFYYKLIGPFLDKIVKKGATCECED